MNSCIPVFSLPGYCHLWIQELEFLATLFQRWSRVRFNNKLKNICLQISLIYFFQYIFCYHALKVYSFLKPCSGFAWAAIRKYNMNTDTCTSGAGGWDRTIDSLVSDWAAQQNCFKEKRRGMEAILFLWASHVGANIQWEKTLHSSRIYWEAGVWRTFSPFEYHW